MVERAIAGGSDQIGPKGLVHLERLSASPQLEQYLLRYLLRQGALTNDRFRHSHEVGVVRAKNGVKRALLSGPDPGLQIPLARVVRVQVG